MVEDIEKMLRRVISETIRLVTNLDPAPGCVSADRGQIRRVLMNPAVYLLVTDVIIRGMAGRRLADRVRANSPVRESPSCPAIQKKPSSSLVVDQDQVSCLRKPFRPSRLSDQARSILTV